MRRRIEPTLHSSLWRERYHGPLERVNARAMTVVFPYLSLPPRLVLRCSCHVAASDRSFDLSQFANGRTPLMHSAQTIDSRPGRSGALVVADVSATPGFPTTILPGFSQRSMGRAQNGQSTT